MKEPRVSIIILNWNGWKDTIECLESLHAIEYQNYDVLLIDNNSQDESIEMFNRYCQGHIKVESKYPLIDVKNKPLNRYVYEEGQSKRKFNQKEYFKIAANRKIILVLNKKNHGFAEGNNIGIRFAQKNLKPDYICLLNNDTIVDRNWLKELVKGISSDKKIGFCSSKLLMYDDNKIINSTGIMIIRDGTAIDRGRNRIDENQYDNQTSVFGACAAGAIYSTDALNDAGILDDDFFAYFEDVDLSWRLQLLGWKCRYVPTAVVYHKYSKSSGSSSLFKVYQGERNRIWIIIKNYPFMLLIIAFPYNLLKLILLFYYNLQGQGRGTWYSGEHSLKKILLTMIKGRVQAWIGLGKMIRKRQRIMKKKKVTKIINYNSSFKTDLICLPISIIEH
jgi:GT2 family glycosyltransferase